MPGADPATDEVDVRLWMPMFWRDFFADTEDLDELEGWAYIRLLGQMWLQGGALPCDPERLRRLAKMSRECWPRVWSRLRDYFTVDGDRLTQKRLSAEYARAIRQREIRSQKGKKGAAARWGGDGPGNGPSNGTGMPEAMPDGMPSGMPGPMPGDAPAPAPAPLPVQEQARDSSARARIFDLDEVLDVDPKAPPKAEAEGGPRTERDAGELYRALLDVADDWQKLRSVDVPADPVIQRGPWSIKRRQMADGLVETGGRHGAEILRGALQMGWLDLGDGKRWPGWKSKLATPEGAARTLANSQLVDQYRAFVERRERERKDSHVPRTTPDRPVPTVADLEEFRRAREAVRGEIRRRAGGSK